MESGPWLAGSGIGEGGETVVKVPDGGRQVAFSEKLLEAVGPQQAVAFAEKDDRYRDLAAGVEEAWKAQVGAAGWHRTDLEGTVSFVSDGNKLTTQVAQAAKSADFVGLRGKLPLDMDEHTAILVDGL